MSVHRPLVMVWVLAGGLVLTSGCFFGSAGSDCAPGDKVQCVCSDQVAGVEVCRDDGTYGACQCGVLPDGGVVGGGDGGPRGGDGGVTDGGITDGGITDGGVTDGGTTDGGMGDGGTADGGVTCAPGLSACGAVCVDLGSDPAHCGSCDRPCPATASCNQAACLCPGGEQICGAGCADTQSDALNCGTCGHACPISQACVGGTCQTPPDCTTQGCTGFNYCDPNTKTCLPGCDKDAQCTGGKVCDTTAHACACPSGLTACSGTCVDTTRDGAHCGSCAHACTASQVCLSSTCQDQGVACTGYDGTGRLATCSQSSPCQSASFTCISPSLLSSANVCVDTTPCKTSPTARCCEPGEFCGIGVGVLGISGNTPFCCVPGESVDSSGTTCGASGQLLGCQTDADCPKVWGLPYCGTQFSPPHCMACKQDSDCPSGKHCYTSDGTCVTCVSSNDCTGGKVCDTANHACVDCVSDSQCGGTTPRCDTTTNTCVGCLQNADCAGTGTPYCDTTKHTCAACTQDSQCTSALAPYCAGGACSQCPSNTVCQSDAGRNACLGLISVPSSCLTDSDCTGNEICVPVNGSTPYNTCAPPC